jgi:hypothetical protein
MSIYAVIFCYKVDSEGNYRDETDDILAVKVVNQQLNAEKMIDSGVTDDVYDDLSVGTHVKFEGFNVRYLGVTNSSEDDLLDRIKEDMEEMLQTKELEFVDEFEVYATVSRKTN